jgi:hypothetical protein
MPFARRKIARWFPLVAAGCAGALVACSGSPDSGLMSPETRLGGTPDGASDASLGTAYQAADGSAEMQAASSATPGPSDVERGDGVALDGSVGAAAPLDAGTDTDATSLSDAAATDAETAPTDAGLCSVSFTVTGALVDGIVFQNVVLGGDAPALGGWDPSQVVKMTASAVVGTWTTTVLLPDGTTVHFKFGMTGTGGQFSWETDPQDVDRTLAISCAFGVGVSYTGMMNQIPDGGS